MLSSWDGSAKKSNYTVNESLGTLTVTESANEIVVTTTGGEYTYDGHVHQVTLNYYAQNADNDLYSKLDEYCQTANSDGSFSAKDIAGLQYSYSDNKDWNEQGRYYTTYNFYYNRLNYSLEFYNNSDEADEVHSQSSVRYGKNIAGYMPGQNLTVTVVYKKTSTEPQNPKTPTTPANKPQSDKSADTGDGFSLITWMLLAMIGAAGAVGTGFAVRKREDDNE